MIILLQPVFTDCLYSLDASIHYSFWTFRGIRPIMVLQGWNCSSMALSMILVPSGWKRILTTVSVIDFLWINEVWSDQRYTIPFRDVTHSTSSWKRWGIDCVWRYYSGGTGKLTHFYSSCILTWPKRKRSFFAWLLRWQNQQHISARTSLFPQFCWATYKCQDSLFLQFCILYHRVSFSKPAP